MKASHIPTALHTGYGQTRATIKDALEASGKDMKTQGGINLLEFPEKAAASKFFDDLNAFGLFPVRGGELEYWLPELKVPGKKTDWTVAMLERLGSDPDKSSYIKPGNSDV